MRPSGTSTVQLLVKNARLHRPADEHAQEAGRVTVPTTSLVGRPRTDPLHGAACGVEILYCYDTTRTCQQEHMIRSVEVKTIHVIQGMLERVKIVKTSQEVNMSKGVSNVHAMAGVIECHASASPDAVWVLVAARTSRNLERSDARRVVSSRRHCRASRCRDVPPARLTCCCVSARESAADYVGDLLD